MRYDYMKDVFGHITNGLPENKSKEWANYCESFGALLSVLASYNVPDPNGKYKSIDEKDYEIINDLFVQATNASAEFLNQPFDEKDANEDFRYSMVKNLNDDFLTKAYIEYQNIKPDPNVSLIKSMENFRTKVINVTGDEMKTVGDKMSTRTQLTLNLDGKPTKGIFTKTSTFDVYDKYIEFVDDISSQYPGYNDFYSKIKTKEMFSIISAIPLDDFFEEEKYDKKIFKAHLEGELSDELQNMFDEYIDDNVFSSTLLDIIEMCGPLSQNMTINHDGIGMEYGDNIDKRNSAMSGIAHLLENDQLLAKSTPVTIKQTINGKEEEVTGTFMEFAKGKDILNIDTTDEIFTYTTKNFDTVAGKRSIANLQIIDFICGNVDRHAGNMFYDFDPVTKELRGVQGIDNDASFFIDKITPNDHILKCGGINEFGVIDEEMAEKVAKLEEGPFKATLHGYGLKGEAIEAAWSRTKELQEAINKNEVYDPKNKFEYKAPKEGARLIIIPKDAWGKLSLSELGRGKFNSFELVNNLPRILRVPKKPFRNYGIATSFHEHKATVKTEAAANLIDEAKRAKNFIGSSKRYNNIINGLKALDDAEGKEKVERLNELKGYIKTYYDEKKALGHLDQNNNAIKLKGKDLARVEIVHKLEKCVEQALLANKELDELKEEEKRETEKAEKYNKGIEELKKREKEAEKSQKISVSLEEKPEIKKEEKIVEDKTVVKEKDEPAKESIITEQKDIEQISISLDDDVEIKVEEKQVEDKSKKLEKTEIKI